jgi:hypothetical protein
VGEAADAAAFPCLKSTVRGLGLLHTDQPVVVQHTPLHQRVAGSPPYVRLKALDPDEGSDLLKPG